MDYFAEIIGLENVKKALKTLVSSGNLPHGLILAGPSGIGKRSLLLSLAHKILYPPASQFNSPLEEHPDFNLLTAEKNAIKVEKIREVVDYFSEKPVIGNSKVLVIDKPESMTIEAANAFLKSLEEPPDNAYILMSSSQPENLPETILSRCKVFRCPRPSFAQKTKILPAKFSELEDLLELFDGLPDQTLNSEDLRERVSEVSRKIKTRDYRLLARPWLEEVSSPAPIFRAAFNIYFENTLKLIASSKKDYQSRLRVEKGIQLMETVLEYEKAYLLEANKKLLSSGFFAQLEQTTK